jgi:thioredoxin-related protein
MKLLLAFLITTITFFMPLDWATDFEKAKKEAGQSQKLILLNFAGSDWCVPCIKMKKEIFESSAFTQYATSNLLLVKADFPRLKKNKLSKQQTKQNEILAERYNPQGAFPFTVLLDANGKILKTWNGMPKSDAKTFINDISAVKNAQ